MKTTPSPRTLAATAVLALAGSGASFGAFAQGTSSVTLYGSIDQYLNYMHSSSGATVSDRSTRPSAPTMAASRMPVPVADSRFSV